MTRQRKGNVIQLRQVANPDNPTIPEPLLHRLSKVRKYLEPHSDRALAVLAEWAITRLIPDLMDRHRGTSPAIPRLRGMRHLTTAALKRQCVAVHADLLGFSINSRPGDSLSHPLFCVAELLRATHPVGHGYAATQPIDFADTMMGLDWLIQLHHDIFERTDPAAHPAAMAALEEMMS